MNNTGINDKGLGILKRVSLKKTQNNGYNHQNPFGISYKGNILTRDVFERSNQELNQQTFKEKLISRGKLYASAMTGHFADINNSVKKMFSPVIAFTSNIKNKADQFITFAKNTEVQIPSLNYDSLFGIFAKKQTQSNNQLANKPVKELKEMLQSQLAGLSA